MYISLSIYIYMYMYVCIYIYIYIYSFRYFSCGLGPQRGGAAAARGAQRGAAGETCRRNLLGWLRLGWLETS